MFIIHLAWGGCLKAPPIRYGITADTGGHIAYVLDAATTQALRDDVSEVIVVTRRFEEPDLPAEHGLAVERIDGKLTVRRLGSNRRGYLEKEALTAEMPDLTAAFCDYLAALPRRPDVIHAHFADAAMTAAEARRRFGVPFVYTPHALGLTKAEHDRGAAGLEGRIAVERRAIADADAIVVSTRDEADKQVQAYGVAGAAKRTVCLRPGVPLKRPSTGRPSIADELRRTLADPGKPILLTIARPVRKKNLAALVRAFASSSELQREANLVILAGQRGGRMSAEEDTVVAEIDLLCRGSDLIGRVALPTRHDEADVSALYAWAAQGGVFVNPALHEPFGLTLLEAASQGVPVVATRNGGAREILDTIGHGMSVEPGDAAAIAAACLRVISDKHLHRRLARAGRRGVELYDWRRYAADSVELYRSLRPREAILVCDIDGTLTGCPEGARAFSTWAAVSRLPFVVATGRSFDAARSVLEAWRLPQPHAFIVDVGTRLILRSDEHGWRECPAYADALDRDWKRDRVEEALAGLGLRPQPAETAGPHKLSFLGSKADAAAIRSALAAAGLRAVVIHSHGDLIDVLAPHGGKAAGVAAYAERRGLGLSECVAAGDSGNDADMLSACGRAIIVGNAWSDLDDLQERDGLYRASRHHAAGVLEGLSAMGLADAETLQ